jgi:protein arginine kinase activator
MGCTHDYEFFVSRLMPLVKRAHEGAIEHVGKVPKARRGMVSQTDRLRVAARAKRELQRAVDAENYELAAQLRDQLKQLELS